ncbi:MAG: Bax inhibitor-1 family protein [Planctomycetota bacterium]
MSQYQQPEYLGQRETVGTLAYAAPEATRGSFIRKTYLHLLGAVLALAAIDTAILTLVPAETLNAIFGTVLGGQWGWLIVLGAFMLVSWIAESMARSATSIGIQYAGLSLYVVAQAVILVPLLWIATTVPAFDGILFQALVITVVMFGSLTAFVMLTGYNFGFLRGILMIVGIGAMIGIIGSIAFGFTLGLWFTVLMIAFACGSILYQTSAVMHDYRIGQHVAASLALFAAVALLFWYVLRLLMSLRNE